MEKTKSQEFIDCQEFIDYVLQRSKHDTGFSAKLRRADNPDTEYQSWEYLSRWCKDFNNDHKRTCYAVVAAGLARMKKSTDKPISLGTIVFMCSSNSDMRLRRLLACDFNEICQWVHPILRLAESKGVCPNFAQLLNDLLYFNDRIKKRWALDFYKKKENEDDCIDV
jgi:CRISPR system Cascade subunit CasB